MLDFLEFIADDLISGLGFDIEAVEGDSAVHSLGNGLDIFFEVLQGVKRAVEFRLFLLFFLAFLLGFDAESNGLSPESSNKFELSVVKKLA